MILAPRPGRIVEKIKLNFSERFAQGESARSIKSDPEFIQTREHVLSLVFQQNEAYSASNHLNRVADTALFEKS